MKSLVTRFLAIAVAVGALTLLGGCATSGGYADANDPFEPYNRKFHSFNDFLDDNILRPIADGYTAITTDGIRNSVTNFFDNVSYPNVILNDLLQFKIGQGVQDALRLVANSTLGIGGLFDVATDMGLPAHNEDLGQTLATWGVGEIAYLEIPFLGPSSFRDVTDKPVASRIDLLELVSSTAITLPLLALEIVNARANLSSAIALRDRSALDPYVFTREAYRQRRRFLIYDGEPPDEEFERLEQSSGLYEIPAASPGRAALASS